MAKITEVVFQRATKVSNYRQFDGRGSSVDDLMDLGQKVSEKLGARKIWMLNSTASGGGVAEMMPQMCSLLCDLGVDTHWLVLEPEASDFFRVTKALHNMIHGQSAGATSGFQEVYDQVSRDAAEALRATVSRHDVLVVHDPQPLGIARFIPPEAMPRLIWRCHIGVPERSEATDAAWQFLRPYLVPYERLLFSSEMYIPEGLFDRSGVLTPSIDPLSHKNRHLHPYKLQGILRVAGLVAGPPTPPWTKFKATATRFVEGRWVAAPIERLLYSPMIVQVSRFDRLKGFQYLIPAFEHLLSTFPDRVPRMRVDSERADSELRLVELILAGPDPSGVTDDPEANEVLEELCAQYLRLPPAVRARTHLLRLPMVDTRENALAVNALQRVASLIVQNSVQEGFGLTVTEAMWKWVPIVASNAGGISLQLRNNTDGLLIHDPTDACALGEAMLRMLAYSKESEAMAISARNRVREQFLITSQVRRWLEELGTLLGKPRPSGT